MKNFPNSNSLIIDYIVFHKGQYFNVHLSNRTAILLVRKALADSRRTVYQKEHDVIVEDISPGRIQGCAGLLP